MTDQWTQAGPIPDIMSPVQEDELGQNELLEAELRSTLRYLYDPVHLRRSPLVGLLGLQASENVSQALRHALEMAISALRPPKGSPPSSRSQRSYQILFLRYVQQFTQRDIANQLGISTRHLRREQGYAVEALADYLSERYGLTSERCAMLATEPRGSVHVPDSDEAGQDGAVEQEMHWLGNSFADRVADVGTAIAEAVRLAQSLAVQHHVTLTYTLADGLPPANIASMVLRQVVLNLITAAIRTLRRGCVSVTGCSGHHQIEIRVVATAGDADVWNAPDQSALDMAARLVDLFGGTLRASYADEPFGTTVTLQSAQRVLVLAIEDNADTLRLWERYVQDTHFELMPVHDPRRALSLAEELEPELIVLDVMMPKIDGWELLGQLRSHPSTGAIPVIVCTVLPQRELALSLGASDFIQKPATRQSFGEVLARQIGEKGRE